MNHHNQQQQLQASPGLSSNSSSISNSSSTSLTKHWSQKKHESILDTSNTNHHDLESSLLIKLNGGSDNGQFVYLSNDYDPSELAYLTNGKLLPNEIILEIQSNKISGYTLFDVIDLITKLCKTSKTITFRSVKSSSNDTSNFLPLDLRSYLDARFQKGSIDYDLQQTIRENVYMRTVPCTTRLPRNGEINGQDYIFLSDEQFLELEQNGDLLEYGVYNGHYYGTPKPPKRKILINSFEAQSPKIRSLLNGNDLPPKRNNSINDILNINKAYEQQVGSEYNSNLIYTNTTSNGAEPISSQKEDANNQLKNPNESGAEVIPYGWEKVEDPEYGTFYIDHINKQTTYENPYLMQQHQQIMSQNNKNLKLRTFKPSTSSLNGQEQDPYQDQIQAQSRRNMYFTQDPHELKGEFIKTSLLKTSNGFGFTIIGANETSEDFLQIKYIVPEGAASRDAKLRQGDVLVYVNNECVLGYTHQDVVEIFQSIPIGNLVDLTVCRGYPLSIDPNDPNIEIMPLAAINNPNILQAPLAVVDEMNSSTSVINQKQIPVQIEQNSFDEYYCEEYEEMYAPIVKGPKGFGFTIADDSQMNHQKVKQILDRERCVNLLENDILLEINGIELRNLNHNQVVEILKECVKGDETVIRLKRRKYQIVLPQPPATSSLVFNNQEIKNRRSKTPNILQSSSSNTNILNTGTCRQTANIAPQHQPQLRSKTPTTDRLLFQHSVPSNPAASPPKNPNDYIYLNGNSNKTSNINELYSTVNRKQQDQLDNGNSKHIPIYDSTTNLQHQRVQQNLNKFHQQHQLQQQQQQQQVNPLIANRSKTPGPEMIYFRNNNNNADLNQQNNLSNFIHNKSATISNGTNQNFISRSKTPTADIMYYPNKQHQPIRSSMNSNLFDNIYQPFNNINSNNTETNNLYNTNLGDETNYIEYSNDDILQLLKSSNASKSSLNITSDVDGSFYIEMVIDLIRQDSGFGFRIVGGEEEGSQVAVGYIVDGGSAHLDTRLRPNDEIVMIDNECVLGSTHRRVVQLMTIAGLNRKVKLMVRRKITQQQYNLLINYQQQQLRARQTPVQNFNVSPSVSSAKYPYTITLFRNGNEGFGFVIISTLNKNGPSIGKIVENSPAERSKRLNVGDRILAVNGINITQMNHIDIVKLIKESGNSITLSIGSPLIQDEPKPNTQSEYGQIPTLKLQNGGDGTLGRQFMTSPGTQIRQSMPTKAIINQNEFHVIELRKHQSNGFGFSIRGGKEFNIPLFVLKLAEYGPAAVDGRLQVGDQILEINGFDAYLMTHSEAIEIIKSGGNVVNLVIRRTGLPPPSITDIIAANSTAAVASAQHQQQHQQQQQQQQTQPQLVPSVSTTNLNLNNEIGQAHHLRSKSPYLNQSYQIQQQHQVKHFNSSGTLINRNF